MYSFTNINDIRELAIYYQKHGMYPYYDEYLEIFEDLNRDQKKGEPTLFPIIEDMSYSAQEFATYWRNRFLNGVNIGGVYYTGEHIFYLNACQIQRVIYKDDGIFKEKTLNRKKVGVRDAGFPDFWDEDYKYFAGCHIARWGTKRLRDDFMQPTETRVEAYKRIYHDIDLGLVVDEANLSGGLNHLYLKPRGVGFSWKLGNYNNYNINLIPGSSNFVVADSKEYLGDKDGIMSKFVKLRDFTQSHVWFLRKNYYKNSPTDNAFATGFKQSVGGTEVISGFASAVTGTIADGDTDKLRGKRGNVSYEEFGSFPKVDVLWQKSIPCVNEYGVVYGQMRGGGTGGGTGEGYEALERMFYDPHTYDIIKYKNPFEEAYRGAGCAMFTPAYVNITFKDVNGNSLKEEAKEELDFEREEKKAAPDPTVYVNFCAEKPYQPNEAFNAAGNNRLPIDLAKQQLAILTMSNRDRELCRYGDFMLDENGIKFKVDPMLKPYEAYPVKAGDKEGCIVVLKEPFRINGLVPDNLYAISVDPYSDEEATDSPSIGSFVIEENVNTITPSKGGLEVCWYDGRPEGYDGQDRFCRRLFYAAEYYNAKIIIENNQKGNVVNYATKHKDSLGRPLTDYLHEQLGLGYDPRLATKKKMKREYGIHMTEARKLQGLKDYQEYLLIPRGHRENADGTVSKLLNIHFCYNRGLLQEIISFNGSNADRISCRLVKMFTIKEYEENNKKIRAQKDTYDDFFDQMLYQ